MDSIEQRFKRHIIDGKKYKMKNRPLYNAFNKYGIEHFSIHLIEECDENILGEREKYWIKYYNSKENGYNATLGGDGSTLYDYDEILSLYEDGMTGAEICKCLGCERGVVQRCLRNANVDPFKNAICNTKKSVIMLDKNENKLKEFESFSDAARWLIENQYTTTKVVAIASNISRATRGIRKTCYGFKWKVKDD